MSIVSVGGHARGWHHFMIEDSDLDNYSAKIGGTAQRIIANRAWRDRMLALLIAHLCAAVVAPLLMNRLGRNGFIFLALVPAADVVWALAMSPAVLSETSLRIQEQVNWIPGLGLDVWFRLDVLSWVMMLIVGGVGALVLVYASRYFSTSSSGLGRFAASFVFFAGAMLGVVTVDHTIGLYVFWELTSLSSFLLIGHHFERRVARAAAKQALLVTTSGSLAMFAGFVMLGLTSGGSFRISELVASLISGNIDVHSIYMQMAATLVLIGAMTKSAIYPAHFWLPGAMAAPTPVSAYLHAAAMVKAGLYLIARMTPGMTYVDLWSPIIIVFALLTMLIGGVMALRQYDLKLVLAYGTVSQLGLMAALLGHGDAALLISGLVLLIAHACFKSTLFLTAGAVEYATGTRDLRKLSGLARRLPVLAVAGGLATISMAGIPITTGYLGKEGAIAGLLHSIMSGDRHGIIDTLLQRDLIILVVIAIGSMMTVAYSWRVWWGAFGTRPIREAADETAQQGSQSSNSGGVKSLPAQMLIPICILSLGAFIGLFPHTLENILSPVVEHSPGTVHLALWSGWAPAAVTLIIVVVGAQIAYKNTRSTGSSTVNVAPAESVFARFSPIYLYTWTLRELEIISGRVSRLTQRGSLPWDLALIFITLIIGVGASLVISPPARIAIQIWDSPLQLGIAFIIILCSLLTVRSRRRMRAVCALSGVGLGVILLFAGQGAPDLALTQLVVEAVSIVVFVLVLRRLPSTFSDRPLPRSRWWRLCVAIIVGVGVIVVGLYASAARIHAPVSELMPHEAFEFGYGSNIVNVILVDIRGWDTVGELSVLLVIATGIASLTHFKTTKEKKATHLNASGSQQTSFLPTVSHLRIQDRSMVLEVTTHLLFPTMLVISVWLMLIGHNHPGGGFAGGVVAGLAFVLRYLAGGREELEAAMPIPNGRILGTGLFVAAAGALAPLLYGNSVLQSTPIDLHLGFLGDVHLTTAMALDLGVYLLVVGVVLDLVSSVGAEIDRQPPIPLIPDKGSKQNLDRTNRAAKTKHEQVHP